MSESPSLPIQTAVYQRLTGDATLMALISGVFDEVPEGTPKPYVHWPASDFETPDNTLTEFGARTVAEVDVWSNHQGYSEAKTIGNRVVELLDHQTLTVTGHAVVAVRIEFAQSLPDPDITIRRRKLRFAFITEQA